jgi:hypothetical protein
MKKLVGLLFMTPTLWACPDLSGAYKVCKNLTTRLEYKADLKISQRVIRRVHHYTFTSKDPQTGETSVENFEANGRVKVQTERDPDSGDIITLKTIVYCEQGEMKSQMDLFYNDELMTQIFSSHIKVNNQLHQMVKYLDQGREKVEETICE